MSSGGRSQVVPLDVAQRDVEAQGEAAPRKFPESAFTFRPIGRPLLANERGSDGRVVGADRQAAFVKSAVPSWRALPNTVSVTLTAFAGGTNSLVKKAQISGAGSEAVAPQAVVYRKENGLDPRAVALVRKDDDNIEQKRLVFDTFVDGQPPEGTPFRLSLRGPHGRVRSGSCGP